MRVRRRALIGTALGIWGTIGMAAAADTTVVSLGTATPGGGFPAYGEAFVAAIHAADPSLQVEPRHTKGSSENVPLLEAGELDLALVQGEVAYEALRGIGRAPADLRIFAVMYSSPGMFVVRADRPYRAIEDLKGQRVAFGARGSGLVLLASYVLDGLGLARDRDFEPVLLESAGQAAGMVLGGEVAGLWGAGVGWPPFVAVTQGPAGARFIVPDRAGIERIRAKHPFLLPLTIAAGSYPGQSAAIDSIGSWSYVLVRPSLEDATVYRLAKALHQAEGDLGRRLAQARETTAANTVAAATRKDLHPGVARYFREAGLLPPKS
jgi:TRAP transporter TAXI family solute receptor